jgi:hypothetical protein
MPLITWNVNGSGLWSVASNWHPGGHVPDPSNTAEIAQLGTGPYTVTYDTSAQPIIAGLAINSTNATLAFASGQILDVTGNTDVVAGTIDILAQGAELHTTALDLVNLLGAAVVDVGDGGNLVATTGSIDDLGTIESTSGLGLVTGGLFGTGTAEAAGGHLLLETNIQASGLSYLVSASPSSTLEIAGTVDAGQAFTFKGAAGELLFSNPATVTANVAGMNVGTSDINPTNVVGLDGTFTIVGSNQHTGTSATVALSNGTITDTLTLSGITGSTGGNWFVNTEDIGTTTNVFLSTVVCYASGTRIATPGGEAAVVDLQIGDVVLTASGAEKPIKWIGRLSYSETAVAEAPHLRPVLIRKDALGDGLPRRDLTVSPMHALYLDDVFIPASALVNGVSILRRESEGPVEYIHIELHDHDVLLAEGVPAESFVDDDSRTMFDNASEYYDLYGFAERQRAFCAPRLEEGYRLEAIRRRFASRVSIAPSVAAPGEMAGHVERLRDGELEGWVMDRANPDTPVELEVLVDGEIVAMALANRYRPDLDRAGLAGGRCAFLVAMPAVAEDVSQVEVRRASDGSWLPMPRPVRQRLAERVPQRATTTDPDLRLRSRRPQRPNGRPVYQDGNLVIFNLPRGSREIRLISRAQSPSEARPWLEDRRTLGVCVKRIVLRGMDDLREIPLDHPGLTKGWWDVEQDGQMMSRWTDGDAVVPLPAMDGPVMLELHLAGKMIYAVEAEPQESQSAPLRFTIAA